MTLLGDRVYLVKLPGLLELMCKTTLPLDVLAKSHPTVVQKGG